MTNITINTDASFHPQHKVGGFAFYIVTNYFRIKKGGMLKSANTPFEAELMAITNAIYHLLNCSLPSRVNVVVINTDCLAAIKDIRKHNPKNPISNYIKTLLIKLKKKSQYKKLSFKHVKAHNGTPDARSWVNDWCDKEAKLWMRRKVKQIP